MSKKAIFFALGLFALMAIIACGGNAANTSQPGLSGEIPIDGSSTVFPITEAVAEEFGKLHPNVKVTVGISGTGGGFQKFCNQETVISDASRPIKQSEMDKCAAAGVEFIELPVAIDGLTVMVNPANDFVDCMTIEELHMMWAPESEGKVTRWNQIRPEWPNEPFNLYGPGVDSGTFDYFTEVVNGKSQSSRGDFTASEDDNILVTGIAGDRNALGYFGYAYYVENKDRLKAVAIDGGDGCVEPNTGSIERGVYSPLSRPIFIYVEKGAGVSPRVKALVEFYLTEGRELVGQVGYIAFPDRVYELALSKFRNGTTGPAFGGDNPLKGTVEEVLSQSQ